MPRRECASGASARCASALVVREWRECTRSARLRKCAMRECTCTPPDRQDARMQGTSRAVGPCGSAQWHRPSHVGRCMALVVRNAGRASARWPQVRECESAHVRRLTGKTRACKARAGHTAHVARPNGSLAPARGRWVGSRCESPNGTAHQMWVGACAHVRMHAALQARRAHAQARAGLEAHLARFLAPSLNGGAGGSARMTRAAQ